MSQSGAITPLIDVARARKALVRLLGREVPGRGLPFDEVVELANGDFRFSFEDQSYVLSIGSYAIELEGLCASTATALPNEMPSPNGRYFASLQDGNIVLRAAGDVRPTPLTTDGTSNFAWELEAPRSRLSAGMRREQFSLQSWSPDSNSLFAIKVDRRSVLDGPQRAGAAMGIAHPHLVNVGSKRARRIKLDDTRDQYFTLIGWLPDGSEVLFARHSRDFKTVDVLAASEVDASMRTVVTETAATFVAIQHEVIFGGDNHVTILSDGSSLIWRSARSGWNHFYLYSIGGVLNHALTQGNFPVIDVLDVDGKGAWVYFTAHHDQERPYDVHLCRVPLGGGEVQRLTPIDGQNVVYMSPLKRTFVAVNSRADRPFRTDLYTSDGRHLVAVERADNSALNALGRIQAEEFTVTAADEETLLYGVMYKPADFDPAKQYPVIDHLYCGPQVSMVSHEFSLGECTEKRLDRSLAQLGYVVISVDARGTPERSKAFHDVVYQNWGRNEIADHVATLRQLAQRHSFIDLDRVGVWGWSGGGTNTLNLMFRYPGLYSTGVAVAPVPDQARYDSIYQERYMGLPAENAKGYHDGSAINFAEGLTGNLLLIHGSGDDNVHFQGAELLVNKLVALGKPFTFMDYPNRSHGLYEGPGTTKHLYMLIVRYIEEHVPPGPR